MIEKFNAGPAGVNRVAIVFVHGFNGDRKRTWGRAPDFLAGEPSLPGWNSQEIERLSRLYEGGQS